MHAAAACRRFPLRNAAVIAQDELVRGERDGFADFMRIKTFGKCGGHRASGLIRRPA